MEAGGEGENRQGERGRRRGAREGERWGGAELDGGAHGLPQHVKELDRHALPGRAMAGRPAPPPSESRPVLDLGPVGARGGGGEQEERRQGGATEVGGEGARKEREAAAGRQRAEREREASAGSRRGTAGRRERG
jgi:hypothetical protein